MFRVIALPANEGDSLVVTWGTDAENLHHMLIDGGSRGAGKRVSAALKELGIVHLDVLVVTHIDADHIKGIIDAVNSDFFPTVGDVWFNGKKHLVLPIDSEKAAVESTAQSDAFSAIIEAQMWGWNKAFGGKAVFVPDGVETLPTLDLSGIQVTLLGPPWSALPELLKEWPHAERELAIALENSKEVARLDKLLGFDMERAARRCPDPTAPFDLDELAAAPFDGDTEAPNGASIAFMLEYDNKSAIFTGDAFSSNMEWGIDLMKRQLPLQVNLYKMGHHGSDRNNSAELFSRLRAGRYLFTSNGAIHALPDRETVARLLKSGVARPKLIFNYRTDCTLVWDDAARKKEYRYTASYPAQGSDRIAITLSRRGMKRPRQNEIEE